MNLRIRKFFSYYRPYLGVFFLDMLCALIVSATTLAIPLCIRFITKNLEDGNDNLPLIYWMGGIMLLLVIVHTVCHTFIDYRGHVMGAMMERDMRKELFEHYQKLSFKFYDERKTGQLMTRLTNDTFDLAELYHHGPEDIVIALLNFIGAFIILMLINVKLAFISLLFVPIMAIYGHYYSKKMYRALRESKDRIGDVNAVIEDTLSGIRVVKSFTNEKIEEEKFNIENNRFLKSRKDSYKSEAYFYDGLIFFTQLITVVIVFFGAISISKGTLRLSDLITFLLYITILIEPIQRLANFIRLYQEGLSGFNRFMEVLEVDPDIKDEKEAIELDNVKGNIEFKNVSFKYKEEHDHILKDITLNIKSGEYVALVGPSGVGKSTLFSLIPRFYELSEGDIEIDGKSISSFTLQSLRRNIGVVQQDVYLFSGTVLDNIAYGNLKATEEEIIEAAKKANAHDFIMELPEKYLTDIGQRGVKLSGGQKQRLSLSRVFLKNPPILILDEATSALDNESERAVQESFERLSKNRTTLVIAHRLSTIRNAHRILVLTENGIEEEGSHNELIALEGVYASLYHMQLRAEDSNS